MRTLPRPSREGRRGVHLHLRVHLLRGLRGRDGPHLPELRRRAGAPAASGVQARRIVSDTPRFIVAIPARYGSTRLPGKPLRLLGGRPLIAHVAQHALDAGAARTVVATDDMRVVAQALAEHDAPMATLAAPIQSAPQLFDPNCVKVVCDARGRALYFSRAPLPWPRDAFARDRDALPDDTPFLRHIGIYAYRAGFLKAFAALPPTPLERAEALEQLRALEHGHAIAVRITPEPFPPGVDTVEDLARAERQLQDAEPRA